METSPLKMKKRSRKTGNKSVLSGVPKGLPALIKAYRMQEKAAGVGFDWEKPEQVWEKVIEELGEFNDEVKKGDKDAMEDEFGDLIFSMINYARVMGINPENALERTNLKFKKRFTYLESQAVLNGLSLSEMSLEEMDVFWNEAKKL